MTDWYDSEPVGWAASFGQLGALRCLIDLGAFPFTVNKAGNTALTDAQRERHEKCIRFLEAFKTTNDSKLALKEMESDISSDKRLAEEFNKTKLDPSKIKPDDYKHPECGPRDDQKKAFGWFEGQGWKDKWPVHYAAMKGRFLTRNNRTLSPILS